MTFVQIIEFRNTDIEAARKVNEEWRQATEGKRTARRQVLGRERSDPDRYCAVLFFDSYESAMKNSALSETQKAAEQYQKLSVGPPVFHDLDLLDDRDLAAGMAMTIQEAFEKGTDAFNAHDIDEFATTVADDVVYTAPGGISGKGKESCTQFFAGWLGAFPDAHVDIKAVHIAGDVAVEEGTFTGTHSGVLQAPGGDVPPTGRRVSVDYTQVLRYRDGKIVSFNLMYDQLTMLEQLGLIPPQ